MKRSKYLKVLITKAFVCFFHLNRAITRGHSLKLVKPICCLEVRKFLFAQCIVDNLNGFDESIIARYSINSF